MTTVLRQLHNATLIKLPSGEQRLVNNNLVASLGIPAINKNFRTNTKLKAGTNRHINHKSIVRGCAMNPIDHPHGGNTVGKPLKVTPWGHITKGKPTRSKHKINYCVVKKRKKNNEK